MEREEIRRINRLIEEQRQASAPERVARPVGVTLIAAFQFAKAGILLLLAVLLRERPEMVTTPNSSLYPLIYLATRGRYDSLSAALQGGQLLAELLFLLGLYLGAIGLGVLAVHPWARRTLIFSCGMTLVLWTKSTFWPDPAVSVSPDMTNFYVMLALDAVVLFYLLRSGTADTFASGRNVSSRTE